MFETYTLVCCDKFFVLGIGSPHYSSQKSFVEGDHVSDPPGWRVNR